ncbi:MAG: hypothetical protein ABI656_06095 [bacterium]
MPKTATTTAENTLLSIIERRQSQLGVSDAQLSEALGYTNAAIIPMIKNGMLRLPVKKVSQLAAALDLKAPEVLRTYLKDTDPSLLEALEEIISFDVTSPTEYRLIEKVRELANGQNAAPIVFDGKSVIALVVQN